MLANVGTFVNDLLGLGARAQSLTVLQIAVRALLIYLAGFVLLRFGEHRFVGKNTAFDVVLGFILGSTLSRAINGGSPLGTTLLAGAVLLALHYLFATAALKSGWLHQVIAGSPLPLIQDGEVQEGSLRKSRISEPMLRENLRIHGHVTEPEQVRAAYYEPSGNVSVIPRGGHASSGGSENDAPKSDAQPRVVEVHVEDGVQTVRIELGS